MSQSVPYRHDDPAGSTPLTPSGRRVWTSTGSAPGKWTPSGKLSEIIAHARKCSLALKWAFLGAGRLQVPGFGIRSSECAGRLQLYSGRSSVGASVALERPKHALPCTRKCKDLMLREASFRLFRLWHLTMALPVTWPLPLSSDEHGAPIGLYPGFLC